MEEQSLTSTNQEVHHTLDVASCTSASLISTENYEKLQARLDKTTECMHHYQVLARTEGARAKSMEKKWDREKARADTMEEECGRRIDQVRTFWRDKIYFEGSRPGKILKAAMQRRSLILPLHQK